MPGKIFINYRREDTRADAARIGDRLVSAFGAANVFMDVDNLTAGQRFDQELAKALAETDVFLAVMGPRWTQLLSQRAHSGARDYVREEIALALGRGVTVIPVMIERATLPAEFQLPPDIKALLLHQKHEVSHDRFGRDVADLITAIKTARRARRKASSGGGTARLARQVAAVLAGTIAFGAAVAYFQSQVALKQGRGEPGANSRRSTGAAAGARASAIESSKSDQVAKPAAAASYAPVLVSARSREEAVSRFTELQRKHADLLSRTRGDIREANLGSSGVWFRVFVAPPGSRESANDHCSRLKARGLECYVTSYQP